MRNILLIIGLFISCSIFGATYYASPQGNDGTDSSSTGAFLTWEYGFSQLLNPSGENNLL